MPPHQRKCFITGRLFGAHQFRQSPRVPGQISREYWGSTVFSKWLLWARSVGDIYVMGLKRQKGFKMSTKGGERAQPRPLEGWGAVPKTAVVPHQQVCDSQQQPGRKPGEHGSELGWVLAELMPVQPGKGWIESSLRPGNGHSFSVYARQTHTDDTQVHHHLPWHGSGEAEVWREQPCLSQRTIIKVPH